MYYYGGATAVGLKVNSGVVLGAERRFSYGGFIMSKAARKVYLITDRIGMAAAGLIADMQAIAKNVRAEIKYYELSTEKKVTVRAVSKLIANILYSYKFMPLMSEILVGGVDDTGSHLYIMDPVGSLIEDDYASIGTGAPIAIGIIESSYSKDMSISEAKELAIKSLKAALSRDSMSGDGIDILIITDKGHEEEFIRV